MGKRVRKRTKGVREGKKEREREDRGREGERKGGREREREGEGERGREGEEYLGGGDHKGLQFVAKLRDTNHFASNALPYREVSLHSAL